MSTISREANTNKKKEAFKSFLETNTSPSTDSKRNLSDHQQVYEEEYVEQLTSCTVCGEEVPDAASKKKNCGFCDQVACAEHMRKRRRKKNKWQKICDNCEDKYLYDSYMKLQIKAQESLAVEQQIVTMKHDDLRQVLQNKQQKRRQLIFEVQEIQNKHENQMMKLIKQENRFMSLNNKLQSDEIICGQIQEYIQRMESKIKSNYEEDFRLLSEEDERLSQELSQIEKKCSQVRAAIEKRQRQLEEAYEAWERKQFVKVEQSSPQIQKQQKCVIF